VADFQGLENNNVSQFNLYLFFAFLYHYSDACLIVITVSVSCTLRAYGLLCTLNGLPWAGVWGGPAPASYKYVPQTLMIMLILVLLSNMVSSLSYPPSLPWLQ
jgi:hypothetical protein